MAASIQITYIKETITVRHGETNEILYSRPANQEDWIRIWEAIRNEQTEYQEAITVNPINNNHE